VKRAWIAVILSVAGALAQLPSASAESPARREFIIKAGVMEPADARGDRLRETRTISADPGRRPGWCFIVDPPTDAPYEVYSIHYLPLPPDRLTGDFAGVKPDRAVNGLKTELKRVDGIRPFCFDFHAGGPLGEYRVEVFIDGSLKTTRRLKVVAPPADAAGGRT